MNYDVVPDFAHNDVCKVEVPQGNNKISPGNKKKILLKFEPTSAQVYETKVLLKSKLETRDILVKGTGKNRILRIRVQTHCMIVV